VAVALYRHAVEGKSVLWVEYIPEFECFFKGEDPFYLSRQVPAVF
jgi:two-component system chemotaxis sensor kinase CheA